MTDKFVTVARFSDPMEAQLAVGRLDAEGIKAYLIGDLSLSVFSTVGSLTGQVHLQVGADDQERAVKILEECSPDIVDDRWKAQTEDDSAIWVCPLCGDAVRVILPVCPSCHTLRGSTPETDPADAEAIQDSPSPTRRRHRERRKEASPQGVQKLEEITDRPLPSPEKEDAGEIEVPQLATLHGDQMARSALRSALFGLVLPFLLLFAVYMVFSLLFYDGELSPKGRRDLYFTLAILGAVLLILLLFCAPVRW
jgi:hypothetical protein